MSKPVAVAWAETAEELEGRYRAERDVERRKRLGALWRVRAGDRVGDAGRLAAWGSGRCSAGWGGTARPAKAVRTEDFEARIVARGAACLVVDDEAHHTHDEESEWNRTIRRLHDRLDMGLAAQLDFSATPRYSKDSLFTWTVSDYPLKQAIVDRIVKAPMKGIAPRRSGARTPRC